MADHRAEIVSYSVEQNDRLKAESDDVRGYLDTALRKIESGTVTRAEHARGGVAHE